MDWAKAVVLTSGRSGNAGRPDYVSISKDARLRCSPGFVEKHGMVCGRQDGIILYQLQEERTIALRFCCFREHKDEGARRLNVKGGAYEIKIGSQLKEAGLDPAIVSGKYGVRRERMGGDWVFLLRLDEPLA